MVSCKLEILIVHACGSISIKYSCSPTCVFLLCSNFNKLHSHKYNVLAHTHVHTHKHTHTHICMYCSTYIYIGDLQTYASTNTHKHKHTRLRAIDECYTKAWWRNLAWIPYVLSMALDVKLIFLLTN